jgi:hypothetical protein
MTVSRRVGPRIENFHRARLSHTHICKLRISPVRHGQVDRSKVQDGALLLQDESMFASLTTITTVTRASVYS